MTVVPAWTRAQPVPAGRRTAVAWRVLRAVAAVVLAAVVLLPAAPAAAQTIRERQWHLDALRIDEAHAITTGEGVVVAVVDTGVAADHPDLAGQVLDGVRLVGDDDRGQVDRDGHGTAVAGVVAAHGGPDGALGIALGAKILPVTAHVGDFGGSNVGAAIRWAVDHGADVLNLSVGTSMATAEDVEAVRYALGNDVVVVAAAGNLATESEVAPLADLPGVISVSAVDRAGEFWSGGVQGPEMVLAAPGVDIVTLANNTPEGDPGGYVQVPGGTSIASPMVAGAAALVRAAFPDLPAHEVVNRLVTTAEDLGPAGRDGQYGFGRLDLLAALTADVPEAGSNPLGTPAPALTPMPIGAPDGEDGWLPVEVLLIGAGGLASLVLVGAVVGVVAARSRRG